MTVGIDVEKKLTPAARQALDEIINDYRDRLIVAAADSVRQGGRDLREIAVTDLIIGLNAVSNIQQQRTASIRRALLAAFVVGVVLAFLGVAAPFIENKALEQHWDTVAMVFGLTVAVLVTFAEIARAAQVAESVTIRRTTQSAVGNEAQMFLNSWQQLELAIRAAAAAVAGESTANQPLSKLINQLLKDGVLSINDAARYRELLDVRNGIVHRGETISKDFLQEINREIALLVARIVSSSQSTSGV